MYKLYYMPGRANLAPHILLQEANVPYCLELVDFDKKAQHDPDYVLLNPNARVPTLQGNGLTMFEAAAITMYVADTYSAGKLAPPVHSPLRSAYYQWMIYLTSTVQEALNQWYHPDYFVSDPDCSVDFRQEAEARLDQMWQLLDNELVSKPFLLGDKYSACDAYLFMLATWQRGLPQSIKEWSAVAALFETILSRPAVQRTIQAENIADWFSQTVESSGA